MLSVAQATQHHLIRRITREVFERTWKVAFVTNFEKLSRHSLQTNSGESTQENPQSICQATRPRFKQFKQNRSAVVMRKAHGCIFVSLCVLLSWDDSQPRCRHVLSTNQELCCVMHVRVCVLLSSDDSQPITRHSWGAVLRAKSVDACPSLCVLMSWDDSLPGTKSIILCLE
jgi:hypothetical protein